MSQFEEQPDDFYFGEQPEDTRVSVSLEDSEKSLLDAATRILAAKIAASQASGPISAGDIKESVTTAIKMARLIDKAVRADKER